MVHNIFLLPYIHHWLLFNFFPSLSKLVKRGAYIYCLHFFTSQPSSCPPQGQSAAEGKEFLLLLAQCLSKTELCSFVLDSPGGLPNWIDLTCDRKRRGGDLREKRLAPNSFLAFLGAHIHTTSWSDDRTGGTQWVWEEHSGRPATESVPAHGGPAAAGWGAPSPV